jgi:phosphoadenosine phosphosulfate reductase
MTQTNTLNNTAAQLLSAAQVDELNARFDRATPQEIIAWAAQFFGDGLAMTSSFGADSMSTIHLATQIKPDIRIVVVNTGYLFPETLTFMEEMRRAYRLNVLEFHTKNDPVVWLSINGEPDPRVRNNRDACCAANKNEVTDRAFREIAPLAYLRGIRADQTAERAQMKIVQWSSRFNCWAISPILRWSSRDVFRYMKEHTLPHHPLWEQGYTSIGCNPETCTRPVGAGEDERAGRWAGSDKKECGINLDLGRDI